jgi:endonuclease YncB( thermonuclease family)
VNVVDGDTIDVQLEDGKTHRVRYIGIDTPERDRPLYEEAIQANSKLVLQQNVLLIQDVSDVDSFDRLLRYVIADDIFVNQELVRLGLANAESYPPDVACDDALSSAQLEAQATSQGLWVPTVTPAPSAPKVEIISVNKRDEYVDIENNGNIDVNLAGWLLVSEKGNQSCPLSGTLKVGETLRIWALVSQNGGFSCGFGTNIWNNSEPDPAVLYNPQGIEVSRR